MLPFKVMVENLIFGFANSVKINMHMLPHGILGWGCYYRKTGRGNGPFCFKIYVVQCFTDYSKSKYFREYVASFIVVYKRVYCGNFAPMLKLLGPNSL